MLRRLAPLLVVAALASCTDASPVARAPSPSPSASPSPAAPVTPPRPSPAAAGDVVLAVGSADRLSLYRLRSKSFRAELVRPLARPRNAANVFDVSLSAGPTPVTCVLWQLLADAGFEVRCYDWGDSTGVAVRAADAKTTALALSADGRALAWASSDLNPTLRVGRFVDGQAKDVKAYVGDPKLPPGNDPAKSFSGRGTAGLAWAGPAALAVNVSGESDEGSGLRRFHPGVTQGGWLYREDIAPPTLGRVYDGVCSATSTTAWALDRAQGVYDVNAVAPTRAVEISLPSGRLKRVISEPAEGRDVVAVSGGVRAVVYVTAAQDAGKDRRVYVRYPGAARGTVIEGLPDSRLVVAAA